MLSSSPVKNEDYQNVKSLRGCNFVPLLICHSNVRFDANKLDQCANKYACLFYTPLCFVCNFSIREIDYLLTESGQVKLSLLKLKMTKKHSNI